MLKSLEDPLHPTREWPADLKFRCDFGQTSLVKRSPNGGYVALGMTDGTLAVIDNDTYTILFRFRGHSAPLLDISWSHDASYLVTVGSDWQICTWDLEIKRPIKTKQLDFSPLAVTFDSVSRVACIFGSQLVVYDLLHDTATKYVGPPDAEDATFCIVTFIGSDKNSEESNGNASYDSNTDSYAGSTRLAVGTSKGLLHIYSDPETVASTLRMSAGALRAVTFSRQQNLLAVACSDRAVRLVSLDQSDLAASQISHKFTDLGLHSQWNALTFSQNGEYLYAASDIKQGIVNVWNTETKFVVKQLRGINERLTSLEFDQYRVVLYGTGKDTGSLYIWKADPPKAWASLINQFEHIPDLEVFQEQETSWDLPDLEIKVSPSTPVDIWTREPLKEKTLHFNI